MRGPRGGSDDWCEGCARTIDEIVAWGRLDDEGKRRIWSLLPARRQHVGLAPVIVPQSAHLAAAT
jgi:predicted Fe-S protein YdhL (DUF1289 family)